MSEPCLSIVYDDDNVDDEESVKVVVNATSSMPPLFWETLKSKATIRTLNVQNFDHNEPLDTDEMMLQLSLAIKSHHELESISFYRCDFQDLGHLCVATTDSQRNQLLTLTLSHCTIGLSAAKTLQFMLKSDSILGSLSFRACNFDCQKVVRAIDAGLCQNRNLRTFEITSHDFDFVSVNNRNRLTGAGAMLNINQNIKKLKLSGPFAFWQTSGAANGNQSLEDLSVWSTHIGLEGIETILMKCFLMKSLQTLGFHRCIFTRDAMDLLIFAVSNNKILETLIIDQVEFEQVEIYQQSFGNLQVSTLCLTGSGSRLDSSSTLDDIANNPSIQRLDLTDGGLQTEEEFQKLTHSLLVPNRGPSELIIGEVESSVDVLVEGLQRNSSVKSLTVGSLSERSLVTFARGLATMNGLVKLSIAGLSDDDDYMEAFFQALEHSMEVNTTLQTLTLAGFGCANDTVKRYMPKIQYFLAINRIGRHSLMTAPSVPAGVWAHVLAKTSHEPAGINFVLTSKPDIVVVAAPSRKRKDRNEMSW
jgi:hypothetical protein